MQDVCICKHARTHAYEHILACVVFARGSLCCSENVKVLVKKKSNSGRSETKKRHLFSSVVKVQFVKSIYNFLKMKLIENVEKESRAVVYTQVVGQKHAVIGRLIALAPYFFTSTPTRLIYSSPSVKENQSF